MATHIEYVMEAASSCPPSGAGGWSQVLQTYQIAPAEISDRASRIAVHKNAQGALPEDVRPVLQAVVNMAANSLYQIANQWGPVLAADPLLGQRMQQLQTRLGTLVDEKLKDYEGRLEPDPPGSVGGIFANVAATAKMSPWADLKWKRNMPLSCVGCGAPQAAALDFVCAHCGGPLAGNAR